MEDLESPLIDYHANRDVQATWWYHTGTNHSYRSVHQNSHHMDWHNQPIPFKIYTTLSPRQLPTDFASTGLTPFEALATAETDSQIPGDVLCTVDELAALLYYSGGVTKVGTVPNGGKMYFRAAACTGALYHIELYLVCGQIQDLAAGIYHFGAHDFSLRQLRAGDYRQVLVEASGGDTAMAQAPAILVCSSVFWRNAWKYQARAYRHCFWDSGTILANLLATGSARGLPLRLVSAFVDEPINRLLDLGYNREVALHLVALGQDARNQIPSPPAMNAVHLEVQPYSQSEVTYPAIGEMHAASSLATPQDLADIQISPGNLDRRGLEVQGPLFPLLGQSGVDDGPEARTIEETIQRRGSSRQFRRAPISFGQLSKILMGAVANIPADFVGGDHALMNLPYLIVNDVDGLPAGSYVFHPEKGALEQLKAGDFRERAGHLDLGQELAADASVNIYFLTDLNEALERFGNRGYRLAQTEAAIMGGRVYLGAYAQRLGATGLTFFDDDVIEFFSPHAQGKSVMFLIALGRPTRRL